MISDSPVDFRPDGSIAFTIDDVKIRWRSPKVKHVRSHRNNYQTLVRTSQDLVAPFSLRDDDGRVVNAEYIAALTTKKDVDKWTKALTSFEIDQDAYADAKAEVDQLLADWIIDVHNDLVLEGTIPLDADEWPYWLLSLQFAGKTVQHWGGNPFA